MYLFSKFYVTIVYIVFIVKGQGNTEELNTLYNKIKEIESRIPGFGNSDYKTQKSNDISFDSSQPNIAKKISTNEDLKLYSEDAGYYKTQITDKVRNTDNITSSKKTEDYVVEIEDFTDLDNLDEDLITDFPKLLHEVMLKSGSPESDDGLEKFSNANSYPFMPNSQLDIDDLLDYQDVRSASTNDNQNNKPNLIRNHPTELLKENNEDEISRINKQMYRDVVQLLAHAQKLNPSHSLLTTSFPMTKPMEENHILLQPIRNKVTNNNNLNRRMENFHPDIWPTKAIEPDLNDPALSTKFHGHEKQTMVNSWSDDTGKYNLNPMPNHLLYIFNRRPTLPYRQPLFSNFVRY